MEDLLCLRHCSRFLGHSSKSIDKMGLTSRRKVLYNKEYTSIIIKHMLIKPDFLPEDLPEEAGI